MSSGGELAFQAQIDKVAKQLDWRRFAQANAPRGSTKGWPDRVYFRLGRIVVLEMKAEKDTKVTDEQRAWLAEWRLVACGIIETQSGQPLVRVAIVRPSDYDEVLGWLA